MGAGIRPPRRTNRAGDHGRSGMMGALPSNPPKSTVSPIDLPIAGMTRTAVVLLLITPMEISSAIR